MKRDPKIEGKKVYVIKSAQSGRMTVTPKQGGGDRRNKAQAQPRLRDAMRSRAAAQQ